MQPGVRSGFVVALLALASCSARHASAPARCTLPPSTHVAVGGSAPVTVEFGRDPALVVFNRRWWRLASPGPLTGLAGSGTPAVVVLHGAMTLTAVDRAVFLSDDGRTFLFGPGFVGCQ